MAFLRPGLRSVLQIKNSRALYSTFTTASREVKKNSFLRVSEEVQEALHAKRPVVALETTIYTHGYPYPDNVALASHLESIVRVNGGVPATIGILDGIARVGMAPEELIRLTASAGKKDSLKTSRRDLAYAWKNYNGGTTIAGTMLLAHLAGIRVFATGGLGGVHRGGESSMDISADLTELGRTPVAVISSGCKSFLDIGRTIEYLETQGVAVGTFSDGRSERVDFPAFWSRDSGVRSPMVVQDEIEAAAMIHAQTSLPVQSGLLLANPIPAEASIPKDEMDAYIHEAIRQADAAGATGKDNTPFVLAKIKELSGARSLKANRTLIENNVRRGTIVARELAVLQASEKEAEEQISIPKVAISNLANERKPKSASIQPTADIVIAGALAVDLSCDYVPGDSSSVQPLLNTSNPATITQSLGGVGHNIARSAQLMGASVQLNSAVGSDFSGRTALAQLQSEGMRTDGIQILDSSNHRTAQYIAVNDANKDLTLAMADMRLLESLPQSSVDALEYSLATSQAKWAVFDANLSPSAIQSFLRTAKAAGISTVFEPVSVAKSIHLFEPTGPSRSVPSPPIFPNHTTDLATPNSHELAALHSYISPHLPDNPSWFAVIDALGIPSSGLRTALAITTSAALVDAGVPQQAIRLLPFMPTILTKLGPNGVLLTMLLRNDDPRIRDPSAAQWVLSRNLNDTTHTTQDNDSSPAVGGLYVRYFPVPQPVPREEIQSVNGVGDTFLGALVAALSTPMSGGSQPRIEDVVDFAQRAAALSLRSRESVSPEISGLKFST